MEFGEKALLNIARQETLSIGNFKLLNHRVIHLYFLTEPVSEHQTCVICMEEFEPKQLRQHNACDCVMCGPCLDRTIEHHQGDVDLDDPSMGKLEL